MDIKIIAFVIGISIASALLINTIIKLSFKTPKDDRVNKFDRKSQLKNFTQSNAVKKKIDNYVISDMKYEKRRKKENLLRQSASKMSISDLYVVSILSAIVGGVVVGVALKNIVAAIAFFVIGFLLPTNILTLKKNARMSKLDTQIGVFIRTTVKRYYVTNRFVEAMEASMLDFDGLEPITTELKQTLSEVELGVPVAEALDNMAIRIQNPYMRLFANNFRVATNIGTQEMKERLLDGVLVKYERDTKLKSRLKREIKQPVLEGFLMMSIVPVTFIMQCVNDREYLPFMINEWPGKISVGAVIVLLSLSFWILLGKVGAPLIEEEE